MSQHERPRAAAPAGAGERLAVPTSTTWQDDPRLAGKPLRCSEMAPQVVGANVGEALDLLIAAVEFGPFAPVRAPPAHHRRERSRSTCTRAVRSWTMPVTYGEGSRASRSPPAPSGTSCHPDAQQQASHRCRSFCSPVPRYRCR